ncbi:FAD binding domain-containing protein [Muricoccus aerilatus]|uniref:FAD binding domain-containing protein n=1 Tax=Muricoccus aerilatus TaxID=452982 RepID=UPI0005C1A4E9|nr:FAD binding domain-containing protein [Roseomonas aerilata]
MKAAPFDYIRPVTVAHALELLAQHGPEAKLIAGGQSLVPMMAMRLARPAVLVDVNRLDSLRGIAAGPGTVTTGATTRQRDLEESAVLRGAVPLVGAALRWVGHVQTRNRGTVGGSFVHADPSAELPLAALILDARIHLSSQDGGARVVPASGFFIAAMYTATGETECVTGIDWPVWEGPGVACAFEETSIRHGDFAMASAACQIQLAPDGTCRRAALGLGGMASAPLAFPDLAEALVGRRIDAAAAREVAEAAVSRSEPGTDLQADAAYRRHLAAVLLTRVLLRAGAAPVTALAA